MDFYEVLEKRHSARQFLDKEVEPEKFQKIIDASRRAPSAGNLQAYKIYAVRSKDAKKALAAAALGQGSIAQAAAVLVFCADTEQSSSKYGERGMDLYAVQDATIAAAYSQLAATAEGISCVWVGAFEPLEVSYILKADPGVVPVAIIPLGYRSGPANATSRRPAQEVVMEV